KHQIRHDSETRQKNSKTEKKKRQREPFNAAEIRGNVRLRRRIHRLEKSFAENAVVNYRSIDEPAEARRAVDLSAPFRGAGWAEKNQMFEPQQRFSFAVTFLLFQKRPEREAPMMPDDGRRTKRDDAAGLLQTPAKIDIVAGGVIFRIESANLFESPAIKRHVTAWNVLGDCVGKQNVA